MASLSRSERNLIQPESMGPPELFGPPPPIESLPFGPSPVQIHPLVLVLGPGLARGFSYAGVLRALNDAKIPIGAIFGTEMGSLMGALYAMSANSNQFEWGLLRFKENIFRQKSTFFSTAGVVPSSGDKLETQLKEVFKNKDIQEFKIPINIVIHLKDSGTSMILSGGNAVKILRGALAAPELFLPSNWDGNTQAISAADIRPFLVNEAKMLGIGPVVVIDVLSEAEEAKVQDELKFADLIIRPDLRGMGPLDFHKKTEAVFQGKRALMIHLPEIRRLVGIKERDLN